MKTSQSLHLVIKRIFLAMCMLTIVVSFLSISEVGIHLKAIFVKYLANQRYTATKTFQSQKISARNIDFDPWFNKNSTPSSESAPQQSEKDYFRFKSNMTEYTIPTNFQQLDMRDMYTHVAQGNEFVIIKKLARYRNHTKVGNGDYFIFTVNANINATTPEMFLFVFSGWEKASSINKTYRCCMLHSNGTMTSHVASSKRILKYIELAEYHSRPIICPYKGSGKPEDNPIAVGLVSSNMTCSNDVIYEEPSYHILNSTSRFGICGKLAYGKKDPGQIIEWVEFNKFYGVSKLLVYAYWDLNEEARKVLDYYVQDGILEVVPLARVPVIEKYPRYFSNGNRQMFHDEQVINTDAQERMAEYLYFALIDTDEFLLPNSNFTSFIDVMETLLKINPDASSFVTQVELHPFNWNQTNPELPLMLSQYSNHTEPLINAPKLIHVSARIQPGHAMIHAVHAKAGFRVVRADEKVILLEHYRYCKNVWRKEIQEKCHSKIVRIRSFLIENVANKIQWTVLKVREKLGNTFPNTAKLQIRKTDATDLQGE